LLGTASILTNLVRNSITTSHLSYNVNDRSFQPEQVVEDVFARRPDKRTLQGIGAFVWNECHLQYILTKLQEYGYPGRILLGGPQVSYTSDNLEDYYPQVDVFCRGYGEDAVTKLVHCQVYVTLLHPSLD
jgi:radical SAM superfamily enzyme YgiQ (UPF0313 family)